VLTAIIEAAAEARELLGHVYRAPAKIVNYASGADK
jgi:hypothetical protein